MSYEWISLMGILVGLIFLVYLAYKGGTILLIAPIMAGLVAIISGHNALEFLSGPFMDGFSSFIKSYFLIFMLSSLFGKVMADSGAAQVIAHKMSGFAKRFPGNEQFAGIVALHAISIILTYGGISVFVIVFAMVAIARKLFQDLDIPWHLYLCSTLASGTFTMSMLPGSPAIVNLIPMRYLGTTPTAAPILGIVATIVTIVVGYGYVYWVVKKCEKKGEGFLPTGARIAEAEFKEEKVDLNIPILKCLTPCFILLIVMNLFNQTPELSLIIASISCYLIFRKNFKSFRVTINGGAANSLIPLGNTCAAVGFGSVIAAVAGYQLLLSGLDKIPGSPMVQLIVAVNVSAGITGSASGGLGIALTNLTERFLALGISPEVIHRLAAIASGGLDSLPHSGAIVTALAISRLTHKEAYKHIFILGAVVPNIAVFAAAILANILAM